MNASSCERAEHISCDIEAELLLLRRAVSSGTLAMTVADVTASSQMASDALRALNFNERRITGATVSRAAAIGFLALPTALQAAPAWSQTPAGPDALLAMAERPAAPPGLAAAGAQLFPFTRSMELMREQSLRHHDTTDAKPVADRPAPAVTVSKPVAAKPKVQRLTNGQGASVRLYQVSAGDSLYAIARKTLGSGSRWRDLANANRDRLKNGILLRVGMKLIVPAPVAVTPVSKIQAAVHTGDANRNRVHNSEAKRVDRMYRVVAGDSLYVIAAKRLGNGTRWRELVSLNRATLGSKNLIYPNQWLILPQKVT